MTGYVITCEAELAREDVGAAAGRKAAMMAESHRRVAHLYAQAHSGRLALVDIFNPSDRDSDADATQEARGMTLTHYAIRCGDRTIISCDTLEEARGQAGKWVARLGTGVSIRRVTSEHVETCGRVEPPHIPGGPGDD